MAERPAMVFHRPVMVDEVLEYLQPKSGTIVDACVGGGGHARAILDFPGSCRLLGIDVDPEAIASARRQLANLDNVELVHSSYVDMAEIVRSRGLEPVLGVLMDFGVSLHQLTSPDRGFGHDVSGKLDMRFDRSASEPPALELVRRASKREVLRWLREYGQEPFATRIARRISERKDRLKTTEDLAALVRSSVPGHKARRALARVFQALRIAVNHELDNVARGLDAAIGLLAPGGRLVALSYHSLEDRLVKLHLRAGKRAGILDVLTPKPVRPCLAEVEQNPAARSARLRAAEKRAAQETLSETRR